MVNFKKNLSTGLLLTGLAIPMAAMATNGMNPEGTGVKNRGMGGAGIAIANESASITNNPGAVVAVGDRWDIALGIFSPNPRTYTLTNNNIGFGTGAGNVNFEGSQESDKGIFAIPFFGVTFPIDDKSAWALVVNANGGMNTDYPNNFGSKTGQTGGTGINLAQLFITGTYGRTVSKGVDIGITGIIAYQTFEAEGLGNFKAATTTSDPTAVSDVGQDTATGIGIKIGIRADLGNGVTLGAAYQPTIDMKKFDKYKGLFAEQGDLDIAGTISAGLAWKMSPKTTLAFDYLRIDYGDVAAITNSTTNFVSGSVLFGDSNGPGFGWQSIDVFKLGVEYVYDPTWTLRAGWNHGDNPISSSEVSVNFLAPGVIEDHLTLGFTRNMDDKSELSFNFVHSFKNEVSGDFSPSFGGGTMTIGMEQNFVEMGYSKHF